jgi:hypothetical protein
MDDDKEETLERLRGLLSTDASIEEMREAAREEARQQAEEHIPHGEYGRS